MCFFKRYFFTLVLYVAATSTFVKLDFRTPFLRCTSWWNLRTFSKVYGCLNPEISGPGGRCSAPTWPAKPKNQGRPGCRGGSLWGANEQPAGSPRHGDRPMLFFLSLQEDGDRLWGLVRMLRYAKSCCCRTAGTRGFQTCKKWVKRRQWSHARQKVRI